MFKLSRRDFLNRSAATAGAAGFLSTLGPATARAANVSGYKALVCVFMRGGLDGHDTLLPYDSASYETYAEVREELLTRYRDGAPANSRERGDLLELTPQNGADFGSRAFALPPNMSELHTLFESGEASIIANVGPLREPLDADGYDDRARRPSKLFSHNDQQSTWMSLGAEGARSGWGGRIMDASLASSANVQPIYSAIGVSANDVFLTGDNVIQYQIDSDGVEIVRELEQFYLLGSARDSIAARDIITSHYRDAGARRDNLFERDVVTVANRSIDANASFNEAFEMAEDSTPEFPDNRIAQDLRAVAATIAARSTLQANRQIFLVDFGGFDTHSGQANSLPNLQRNLSRAIAAFQTQMSAMGLADDVTLFTASDFGRTLTVNGDGTDHGWGAHHFVVGGAVNGGRIFGAPPPAELDHSQDAGRGRLIPTTSVEQLGAPLARWFGLNDAEIANALPSLSQFGAPPDFI